MSISQALSNATSGLGVVARQANTASNNIANALTPGYSRRDVSLAERVVGATGAGVGVAGISRAENPALTTQRRLADATAGGDQVRSELIASVSRIIGGPEDANSLFAKFAAFDQSLRTLANAPDSAASQSAALSASKALVSGVANVAQQYQNMRATADSEIGERVDEINLSLREIERLNTAIGTARASGRDASALYDQRKLFVDKIGESIPVRELTRENGRIDLMTSEGVLLLAGAARTIQFSPSSIITAQDSYSGGLGSLSGLMVDGVDITPGGGARQAFGDGVIAGLFAIRDEIVPQASDQLDLLAQDLIERFSTPGVDPTLAPGAAGLFTDNGAALSPPIAPGLAGRIAVNASVDPTQGGLVSRFRDGLGAIKAGPAGSDVLLRDMIAVMDESRVTAAGLGGGRALTALEAASEISSSIGAKRSQLDIESQASKAYASVLREAEISETGVDTDRELQNLLVIEKAYAANARVIESVNEMIQRLLEI